MKFQVVFFRCGRKNADHCSRENPHSQEGTENSVNSCVASDWHPQTKIFTKYGDNGLLAPFNKIIHQIVKTYIMNKVKSRDSVSKENETANIGLDSSVGRALAR